jgi:hypothetical protein
MKALEPLVRLIEGGAGAILWTGRSPRDLDRDEDGQIRPLLEGLRRLLWARLRMVLMTFSRATGLVWDTPEIRNAGLRDTVEAALRAHRLADIGTDIPRFFRSAWVLLRTPGGRSPEGVPLRFALLVEFAQHLFPCAASSSGAEERAAAEWIQLLGTSLALRQNGHALILYAPDEGMLDAQVRAALRRVRLPQPDREAKRRFLDAALPLYPNAHLNGLQPETVATLTANTPNWSLEGLLRQSHLRRELITVRHLIARRSEDVLSISEGMLSPLEENVSELHGETIAHAWRLLERIAEGLRRGDPQTPHNVLLAGAPGFGKTELARRVAAEAGVNAYRIHSPKHGIVGETERRARLLFDILMEWAPNVGFADEITEMLTTERPEYDLDAGASRAVIGALLAYLGDENRRGRTLFLAATNVPWRMSDALRSRFIVIPVLRPPEHDYPGIVATLARRIGGQTVAPDDRRIEEAARIFFEKGCSPRHILGALANTRLLCGRLQEDEILQAAHDFCGDTGYASAIYADLWAIKLTTSKAFFPWHGRPDYPLPEYLKEIVDPRSGEVDHTALDRRLNALRPQAKV